MEPLVTVMIATRNRQADLVETLQLTRRQTYPNIELLVIDDASDEPIEAAVLGCWANAKVVRHSVNRGQSERRNQGFELASGKYVLHLDDDCSLIAETDLAQMVRKAESDPWIGGVVPCVYNSREQPAVDFQGDNGHDACAVSFVGACVLLRREALQRTNGYRSFFTNDREEEELSLQLLSLGYRLAYLPGVIAHHRVSAINRNSVRTWRRGLRNQLWLAVIHLPLRRLPLELAWKIALGAWDAFRLVRPAAYLVGLWQAALGVSRPWRIRKPLDELALLRYDALRFRGVLTADDFSQPAPLSWADLRSWWARWRNRARDMSRWGGEGGTGGSPTSRYAHESKTGRKG